MLSTIESSEFEKCDVVKLITTCSSLDREIESGSLRLADEKRAVQEMSNLRRHRKLVEGFAQQQQAIDADKAQIDALRVHLDDPEHKALMEKSDEIKKGLDETRAEIDQAQASRQTLLDQRTKLQSDLDAVYAEKRQHNETHRETMDAYYQKVNDEKARRAQRAREEKEAEEAQRAKMQAEQMREDAKLPGRCLHQDEEYHLTCFEQPSKHRSMTVKHS